MPVRSPRRPAAPRVPRRVAVLAPVVTLALAGPAGASSWSAPIPVPDGAAGGPAASAQRAGATAAQATDGTVWVAWLQSVDGTTDAVRVARRGADGAWGAPETVAERTRVDGDASSGLLRGPAIDVGADGRPVVLWSAKADDGNDYPLRAARRGTDGTWSAPQALGTESDGAGGAYDGSVALHHTADGRTVAAWRAGSSVHAAVLGTTGSWSATATLGDDLADADPALREVDVASDAEGAVTVVWAGAAGPRVSTRAANGTWGAAQTVAASPAQSAPRIAADAQGELLVTWAPGDGDVRVARRTSAGSAWTAEDVALEGDGAATTLAPDVATDRHGAATLAWTDSDTVDDTTTGTVRTRVRRPDGSWGAATPVHAATGADAPGAARVVVGHDGQATVLWTAGPLLSGRLFAAVRDDGAAAWGPAVALTDPERLRNRVPDGVTADALGNVAVATAPAFDAVVASRTPPTLRTLDAAPAVGTSWTSRWLPGTGNLRSFVGYLHGAPDGGLFPSDGAVKPEPSDRYGLRLTVRDAWRDVATGETVVQHRGTVRMAMPIHFIDIRIVDPTVRIAADGRSARVLASGQGSGERDPSATSPKVDPFTDLALLDLDLRDIAVRTGNGGAVRTYVAAPATIAEGEAMRYLSYPAGTRYGTFTITVPAVLPDRDPTPPGGNPGPGAGSPGDGSSGDGTGAGGDGTGSGGRPVPPAVPPAATPEPTRPARPAAPRPRTVTAKLAGTRRARRSVSLRTSAAIGPRAGRTYRVRLVRGGRTVAAGALRDRRLRLTVRASGRTKAGRPRYARLSGRYVLRAAGGGKANRIPVTTVRVR